MKKKYFLIGAWTVCALCACHNHEHGEEGHDHEAELAAEKDEHEHHPDEIILTVEKAKAAGIATAIVRPGKFHQIIHTSGQILAAQGEETTVVASAPGVVRFARTLTSGMPIGRGTTLFHLSSNRLEGGDPVERAYITYQNAKTEYERALPLAEKQIVSRKDLQALKTAYEDAQVAYEALDPRHARRGVAVTAPSGGFVKNVAVKEGDYVSTGQPLATLTQNRKLQLRADVSERHYGFLAQVRSACFKTPYDDAVYSVDSLHGRLLSYGKASDDTSRYLPVTFEFDNAGTIVPGTLVEVALLGAERTDVLTLPLSALTEEQGMYFIYLQEDREVYRKQEVRIGANDGQRVEILSGLKTGDRVVTQGAMHVKLASASNAIPAHTHSH